MPTTPEQIKQSIDQACQTINQQLEFCQGDLQQLNLQVQAGNPTMEQLEVINNLLNAVDDMTGAVTITVHTCLTHTT